MNIKTLEELCNLRGTSGNEESVAEYIISQIKPYADDIEIDNMGNVLVFKKGKAQASTKLLLSAHMDEVGFIVTTITSDGYLKVDPVGGINPGVVAGRKVCIGDNKIIGAFSARPIHLLDSKNRDKIPSIDSMYVDIGAENAKDAMQYVSLGDMATFCDEPLFDNDRIISRALDDRIGCFVLIEMIKSPLEFDMYFSFVVQEEVGLRGAKTAAFKIAPDAAIVVEATTAADIPGVENEVCNIGDGAVIAFMDKATIYDKNLCRIALSAAKDAGVKAQIKKAVAGGNDSGSISVSRSGVKTVAISVPCRYLHSGASIVAQSDLFAVYKTVSTAAIKIAGNKI